MTRVFILRGNPQSAAQLQSELESTPRLHVVGLARQAGRVQQLAAEAQADIIVSDLRLPDGSAVSLLHDLRTSSAAAGTPCPKVLVLASMAEDGLLIEALRAGADGYQIERDPSRSIGLAIAEAMRGEAVMAPAIARQITGYFSGGGTRAAPLRLSDIDRELLVRLSRGQAPADIARLEPTAGNASAVRQRIRQIYRKMQWDLRIAMTPGPEPEA
jgi:DNA-binding NarL/FixJ family response regulator